MGVCGSGASCRTDSDCGSGEFCNSLGKCQAYRLEGESCGGFILNPPQCAPGLRCQNQINADLGGTCVNNGTFCRPYAQRGQPCNGALPPQFATLCQPPLTCVAGLPGATGVCESTSQSGSETGSETGSEGTGNGNGGSSGNGGASNYNGNGGKGGGSGKGKSGGRQEYEACSSHHWAQNFNLWHGFYPDNTFSYAFDVKFNGKCPTLGQVLQGPSNSIWNTFLKESCGALLNAASPNLGYYYSVREVMALVQAAWNSKTQQQKLIREFQSFSRPNSCPFSSVSSIPNKQSKNSKKQSASGGW